MPRQLEPWGGEVHVPRWVRRLTRRPDPGDSPERAQERRLEATKAQEPEVTPLENADRAIFGGFSRFHPGNQEPRRGE